MIEEYLFSVFVVFALIFLTWCLVFYYITKRSEIVTFAVLAALLIFILSFIIVSLGKTDFYLTWSLLFSLLFVVGFGALDTIAIVLSLIYIKRKREEEKKNE